LGKNQKTADNFNRLRLRKSGEVLETNNSDIDTVLKHHCQLQEELAEHFLNMTMHLKHNVTAAGQVVKEDRRIIERVHTTADKNLTQMELESARLADFVNASCDLWLWVLLFVVLVSFICMVLFIRLFPKRY